MKRRRVRRRYEGTTNTWLVCDEGAIIVLVTSHLVDLAVTKRQIARNVKHGHDVLE
jgi:hypothetical protein